MKINVGDKVRTNKGCRLSGRGGVLEVVKTGLKWTTYEAVSCRKENGKVRLYLVKNLVKV